jgi:hypothetical protein
MQKLVSNEEALIKKIDTMYKEGNQNYQFEEVEAKIVIKLIQIGILDDNAFIPLHTLKSNCFRMKKDFYPFTSNFVSKDEGNPFMKIYQATIAGISEGVINAAKD